MFNPFIKGGFIPPFLDFFMKSLMLAGALFHTFSQAPMPNRANQVNTLNYEVNYQQYRTVSGQSGTGTRTYTIEKNSNTFGLIDVEIYRMSETTTVGFMSNTWSGWVYGKINLSASLDPNITTINKIDIKQNWYSYVGVQNVGYYLRYGEGVAEEFNKIKTATWESLNSLSDPPTTDNEYNLDEEEIGQSNNTIEYTENSYPYYFVFYLGQEDTFFTLQMKQTEISYTYTFTPNEEGIIDIPGLLWNILAMPFGFISTAFNLTIFPGTMYQLNIGHLLLILVNALIIIFVIKRFTR